MALVDRLRSRLSDARAGSFQIMGKDLALLSNTDLLAAADDWEAALARLPPELRADLEREHAEAAVEAHRWLRKHNRSVHTRIAGYVALGRRLSFRYPWPVVAVLGICQVMTGFQRNRLYGLVAHAAGRAGFHSLEQLVEGTEDVLRRTNRGIFADSVPTVLWALRAVALRSAGREALAEALLSGPPPPLMDDESQGLARALAAGLAEPDPAARFAALGALTLRHFAREQAIFTHHMGRRSPREAPLTTRLSSVKEVPAPVVERGRLGRPRVVFRPFALPPGFDMRDHEARVREFSRAFVVPVTASRDDYRAAAAFVLARFGGQGGAAVAGV
jgi:hypothetical protein